MKKQQMLTLTLSQLITNLIKLESFVINRPQPDQLYRDTLVQAKALQDLLKMTEEEFNAKIQDRD